MSKKHVHWERKPFSNNILTLNLASADRHISNRRQAIETLSNLNSPYRETCIVQSGELFDYIVEKGRLLEDEARRYFQQIIRSTAEV
jgi:hypothetical protein